jgi:hypothetical protein
MLTVNYDEALCAECCCPECRYTECRGAHFKVSFLQWNSKFFNIVFVYRGHQ